MCDDADAVDALVPADDGIICSKWPEKDRWALREMNDSLPLDESKSATSAC
jgi:hypothetical protein